MAAKKKKAPLFLKLALIVIIVVFAVSQKDAIGIPFSGISEKIITGDSDTIKAGAFNIQVFGTTKAAKEDVMDVLSRVIREYDIIAIEEIRDGSQTALPELVLLVNSDGSDYSYFVSERLGRTSSKEQYAYIYNTETIKPEVTPFVYPEPYGTDAFHREPYIASFSSIEGIFNATFVTIHTDPDEAKEEIDALYEVSEYAKTILPQDEAVIIMGDFNADGSYFDEDSYTPMKNAGYFWLIGNGIDTTTGTTDCTYDRIVLTEDSTFYTGEAGVFRFDTEYSLSPELTKEVSDHYPVYAVFSAGKPSENNIIQDFFKETNNSGAADIQQDYEKETTIEITGLNVIDDWVTISNKGSYPFEIGNYRISDSDGSNSYIFPAGLVIPPQGMITLYSGEGSNSESDLYWKSPGDVWDDTGDAARHYDPLGFMIGEKIS